ncbi:MFS transporter [Roseateles sp. BYS96W]|uniref:MFS transporter n=1 Tax=Pelomonas nitida TaxID=3299027 RepID=A0ABW7GCX9_9BURK
MRTVASSTRLAMRLILTRGVSAMGSVLTGIALDVWLYQQTGSYAQFAAIAVVSALVSLLVTPLTGVLVDRFNKRLLLAVSECITAAAVLAAAWSWHRGSLDAWGVGFVTATMACTAALRWTTMSVVVSMLVPRDDLERVNGLQQIVEGIVLVLGPVLGAAAVTWVGLGGALAIDCVSTVVALCGLLSVPGPQLGTVAQTAPPRRWWVEMGFGLQWIWQRPALRRLMLFITGYNLVASIFTASFSPYVLAAADGHTLGMAAALEGAGALAAGALLSWRILGGHAREDGVLGCAALFAALMMVWGLVRQPALLCLLASCTGLVTSLLVAWLQMVWQSHVPVDVQGRVFAARRLVSSALTPVSILISVPLAEQLMRPALQAWPAARVLWGLGTAGALGALMSCLGLCLLTGCLLRVAGGGLRVPPATTRSQATPLLPMVDR